MSAGQQFYVKIGGADNTAFGTGHYDLSFAFGSTPPHAVPLQNTQTLNGNPLQSGGGQAEVPSPHGAGCNCPFCRGAQAAQTSILNGPEERATPVEPSVSSAEAVQAQPDTAASEMNLAKTPAATVDAVFLHGSEDGDAGLSTFGEFTTASLFELTSL